ncbi:MULTISPECIES: hypothetical protein [unclassified Methylobacterium]|nr:hypothetical protein [Methylobacterium sp. 2A]
MNEVSDLLPGHHEHEVVVVINQPDWVLPGRNEAVNQADDP